MTHPSKGIAALIAAQGRNGDDELIHVNKQELAALERLGDHVGIKTTTNPHTGLKEAFNWGSTIGGILGGIGGTFLTAPTFGVINPYTGAALGSAAGTKLSGGSNDQALMNGAIAGVTAWGLGSATDALAEAGKEAGKTAVEEGVKTGVQEGAQNLTQQGTQNLFTQAGQSMNAPNLFTQGGDKLVAEGMTPQAGSVVGGNFVPTQAPMQSVAGDVPFEPFAKLDANAVMPDTGYYGVGNVGPQGVNTYTAQGTKELMAGTPNAVPGSITSVPPGEGFKTQAMNPDYWSGVGRGIEALNTPGKVGEFALANKGNLLAGGLGAYGMAIQEPSNPGYSDTGTTGYAGPRYRGEVYYSPYGERRTRAVPYARGGDVYGDYEGVDENADGGYIPGGGLNFAAGGVARFNSGGIGFMQSMQPGGEWGDMTADIYGAVQEHKPQWLQNIEPGGFIGATVPGKMDWEEKKRKEEEEKKRMQMGLKMAAGGISDLGHYSDGGQLLRGAGDGVSDSIPASIENKRPARLADGEFVVPARAVSELGNGSTEAGAKQLYGMLDRIAKKRKKGNGLAYQANPKKLMPA